MTQGSGGQSRAGAAARARRETSAGGVVFRRAGAQTLVLLIRDAHSNWGFPKGHVERGEAVADAAVREVREETGLERLDMVSAIQTIDWRFRFRGRLIHKTCHFFAISSRDVRTKPERREGITACRWVTFDQGAKLLTHDNARGVLATARGTIEGHLSSLAAGAVSPVRAVGAGA